MSHVTPADRPFTVAPTSFLCLARPGRPQMGKKRTPKQQAVISAARSARSGSSKDILIPNTLVPPRSLTRAQLYVSGLEKRIEDQNERITSLSSSNSELRAEKGRPGSISSVRTIHVLPVFFSSSWTCSQHGGCERSGTQTPYPKRKRCRSCDGKISELIRHRCCIRRQCLALNLESSHSRPRPRPCPRPCSPCPRPSFVEVS